MILNNSELKTMEENSSLVHMPRTRKPKIIIIIIRETPKPFPLNLESFLNLMEQKHKVHHLAEIKQYRNTEMDTKHVKKTSNKNGFCYG